MLPRLLALQLGRKICQPPTKQLPMLYLFVSFVAISFLSSELPKGFCDVRTAFWLRSGSFWGTNDVELGLKSFLQWKKGSKSKFDQNNSTVFVFDFFAVF